MADNQVQRRRSLQKQLELDMYRFMDFGSFQSFRKNSTGNCCDYSTMSGHYLILDNTTIYEVIAVQKLIESHEHKAAYLAPYSSFLNPIKLFWSKDKAELNRDCLTASDNLNSRIIESARQVSIDGCQARSGIQLRFSIYNNGNVNFK